MTRGRNPAPQPGDPPRSNPGQPDVGEQYTALDSGQDVQRGGYYVNAADGTIRYYRHGETIPGRDEVWYFLTQEPDVSLDHLRELAARYGMNPHWREFHLET